MNSTDAGIPKNVALILAGGLGSRMGQAVEVPKQFYKLTDKPVIIHTLDIFENHPEVDSICVVCLETWEKYMRECLTHFSLKKVRWIVPGGDVRQQSVYNGLLALRDYCRPQDVVIVHDGVRPFIGGDIISANLRETMAHGTAMTSVSSTDSLLISQNGLDADAALTRSSVYLVQTPQTYRYGVGLDAYKEAYRRGITNSINCCELFISLGQSVRLVPGLKTNIKLTTAEDIDFLHALHAIYNHENDHYVDRQGCVKE